MNHTYRRAIEEQIRFLQEQLAKLDAAPDGDYMQPALDDAQFRMWRHRQRSKEIDEVAVGRMFRREGER